MNIVRGIATEVVPLPLEQSADIIRHNGNLHRSPPYALRGRSACQASRTPRISLSQQINDERKRALFALAPGLRESVMRQTLEASTHLIHSFISTVMGVVGMRSMQRLWFSHCSPLM